MLCEKGTLHLAAFVDREPLIWMPVNHYGVALLDAVRSCGHLQSQCAAGLSANILPLTSFVNEPNFSSTSIDASARLLHRCHCLPLSADENPFTISCCSIEQTVMSAILAFLTHGTQLFYCSRLFHLCRR